MRSIRFYSYVAGLNKLKAIALNQCHGEPARTLHYLSTQDEDHQLSSSMKDGTIPS